MTPTPFALVLDDYHLVRFSLIRDAATFLFDHQPPCMYLVIVTRQGLPLPLSRPRMHDQVTEMRADDLRFTAEEAPTLYQVLIKPEQKKAELANV